MKRREKNVRSKRHNSNSSDRRDNNFRSHFNDHKDQLRHPNTTVNEKPVVLSIEEDLQHPYSQKALNTVKKHIISGEVKIILDFSNVKLITSAGFAFMLGALRLARENSGEVKLCCMNKLAAELLKTAHLDLSFEIFNDADEAIASFKNKTEVLFRQEKRKRINELLRKSYLEDSTEPLY